MVGFSGTRGGLTSRQWQALDDFLGWHDPKLGRHGDCIGADEEFHELCLTSGIPVVIHPPSNPRYRARCEGAEHILPEREYLARNDDILHGSDLIVACPRGYEEVKRGSGTWSMIRHARREHKELYIIYPMGEVLTQEPTVYTYATEWGEVD